MNETTTAAAAPTLDAYDWRNDALSRAAMDRLMDMRTGDE